MKLQYVATEEQIADVLMKPLARVKFEYFSDPGGSKKANFQNHHIETKTVPC